MNQGKLAILAAGGPAPGINSVIGAATIRARLSGVEVIGIRNGFRALMKGDISQVIPLGIKDTGRIHFRGGSHIGISRGSPVGDPEAMKRTLDSLQRLGVTMLITIGGDGTAYVACELAKASAGGLRVVHVPKTIDNDIDLPHDVATFGFHTARQVGVDIVHNLMVDAKTTGRWYLVVAQGRKAGHLALAIGKAAGATLSIIPEEFEGQKISLRHIVDTLVGSMIKRIVEGGRAHGVALLAEGLSSLIEEDELLRYVRQVPRDAQGNVQLASINLGDILEQAVSDRLEELGVDLTVASKEVGYELRCADPNPFDMEYTRDLGYSAARYIIAGGTHAMVSMQSGRFVPIPFFEMLDPDTGKTRVRMVDVASDRYRIARTYMIRLVPADLESPAVERYAQLGLTAERMHEEFDHVVQLEDTFWKRVRGMFEWGAVEMPSAGSSRGLLGGDDA